ncbi:hypothetical protein lerEdw1_005370 [Lerista edwardsae]|nr:hypothetical protein lerEdw1_005370 [Lerista edwardsae]
MAYSTFRKVALASCLVLCVALLLPKAFVSRGWRQQQEPAYAASPTPEGKTSQYPPTMHHQIAPEVRLTTTQFPRSHLAEAVAKAKGAADYELAQLQDKLKETEEAMEKLINRVGPNCESRAQNVTTDQEKRLLQQLREITKVMKEGKLIDGISPEKEAEEAPYMQDWEGYPEETYPVYDNSDCLKRRQDTILVDYPDPNQPSAEEIAERMEFVDDEDCLCSDETLLSALVIVSNDPPAGRERGRHSAPGDRSGAGHNFEKCSCCHYEQDDPVVLAENAGFYSDSCSEAEELAHEEASLDSDLEDTVSKDRSDDNPDEMGMLRKRNTKGLELLGH